MGSGPNQKPPFSIGRVLMVVIPALIVIGAVYAVKNHEFDQASREKDSKLQLQMGLSDHPVVMTLDEEFSDTNGDLVADTPTDRAKLINPDKIVFAFVGGPDAER